MTEDGDLTGIAERVRAARERAGLSREALAVRAEISWSAIAQIETGRRINLRPATLAALAGALGVTIDYLVSGHRPGGVMLEHRAFFYEDDKEFLDAAVGFLVRGIDRSEAALVVTSAGRLAALRERLGARECAVQFIDRREWPRRPGDALRGYRDFVRVSLAAGAPWARIIGEPLWRPGADAVREFSRYESTLNLVLGGDPVSVLCPYNRARLDARIIETAYATHRHTLDGEAVRPSPSYSDPGVYALEEEPPSA